MTPEAGWYPVALADDIEPRTSAGTRLFGRELVVWRDDTGQAHVWEDRCPHRGMRLSFGFVRGNHIACLYHGWQFDAAGRCRYIPAHPKLDVPPSITVERFVAAERLGVIWTFAGADAGGTAPPGGNAATLPVRSIALRADAGRVMLALRRAPAPPNDGGSTVVDSVGGLVTFGSDGMRLHAAVQPVAEGETMLHLAVEPGAGIDRSSISAWAEALRRSLEAGDIRPGTAP